LEGCLRPASLEEIAGFHRLKLAGEQTFSVIVQILPGNPASPADFLSRLQTLRQCLFSEDIIRRFPAEAVEDTAVDKKATWNCALLRQRS